MNTFPAPVEHVPGVFLAKPGVDDCAWTAQACHASQTKHGRGNDCPVHPWPTPRQAGTGYPLVGHRRGLQANDLVTLASAFWITSTSRLADPIEPCDCTSPACTITLHCT